MSAGRCSWCQGDAPKYALRCSECADAQQADADSSIRVCRAADELVREEALGSRSDIARRRKELLEAVRAMRAARHALSIRYQPTQVAGVGL